MNDDVTISQTWVRPSRRPPKHTRCGSCDAKVPLSPKRWIMATDDEGEPFFWNQVRCRCGNWVTAVCMRSHKLH